MGCRTPSPSQTCLTFCTYFFFHGPFHGPLHGYQVVFHQSQASTISPMLSSISPQSSSISPRSSSMSPWSSSFSKMAVYKNSRLFVANMPDGVHVTTEPQLSCPSCLPHVPQHTTSHIWDCFMTDSNSNYFLGRSFPK